MVTPTRWPGVNAKEGWTLAWITLLPTRTSTS